MKKIYTKSGDSGTTELFGGARVPKDDSRVEAYGTIDETNAFMGCARAHVEDDVLSSLLEFVMQKLFNCSCALAHPTDRAPKMYIEESDIDRLEKAIDDFMTEAGPITGFILPTGTPAAGFLHLARTVCRRAERRMVAVNQSEPLDPLLLKFINRTSDFLFAASRYANAIAGKTDINWRP